MKVISKREKLPRRFKIDKNTGCWNYIGVLCKGYGQHRYYYQRYLSVTIPGGMTLDHLCKNIVCVNPEHMEVVTLKENIRRSSYVKLNRDKVNKIRLMYKNGTTQQKIGEMFSVRQDHISRIVNGYRWN